jgi:RNA polymerase sigma factor (sigma-70 family)
VPADETSTLLERYHAGEETALAAILERHGAWLRRYVSRRMGGVHRRFETSEDVVQDVFCKLIRHGPAFVPADDDQFRLIVGTIVLNRLRDRWRWARAGVRDPDREASRPVSRVGLAADSENRPDRLAGEGERRALLELAMELIDPGDAHLIRSHDWDGKDFSVLGEELGIKADAARMRYTRAVQGLGKMARRLRSGDLRDLEAPLAEEDEA